MNNSVCTARRAETTLSHYIYTNTALSVQKTQMTGMIFGFCSKITWFFCLYMCSKARLTAFELSLTLFHDAAFC